MKQLIYHIMRRLPGILLVVLAVASAMAQKPVQHIIVDQCDTYEFSVVDFPGDRYTWHLYHELDWDTVNFATNDGNVGPTPYFEDGMYQGNTVRVNFLDPGRYFLRIMVWDDVACTNNLLVFLIDVEESMPEADIEADEFCYGDPAEIRIILTGRGPWDVSYSYGDGTAVVNLNGITDPVYYAPIPMLDPGITDFWIMEVTDQCTINLYTVPKIVGVRIHPTPENSRIYLKNN